MTANDRTVHARARGGGEVVRYDRAGKWYLENSPEGGRVQITLDEAVFLAIQDGAEIFLGRPGGRRFDACVRYEAA